MATNLFSVASWSSVATFRAYLARELARGEDLTHTEGLCRRAVVDVDTGEVYVPLIGDLTHLSGEVPIYRARFAPLTFSSSRKDKKRKKGGRN